MKVVQLHVQVIVLDRRSTLLRVLQRLSRLCGDDAVVVKQLQRFDRGRSARALAPLLERAQLLRDRDTGVEDVLEAALDSVCKLQLGRIVRLPGAPKRIEVEVGTELGYGCVEP